MAQELNGNRIAFSFFDAFDGDHGKAGFRSIDRKQFEISTGRKLLAQEVGCFASHRALWEKCVAANESFLIFEDDAHLEDHFSQVFDFTRRILPDIGYVRLQHESRGRRKIMGHSRGLTLQRFRKPPQGAMCYAITPMVASEFLKLSHDLTAPIDKFVSHTWLHGQPMYAILPYGVTEAHLATHSTIGERRKTRKSFSMRLQRMRFRMSCFIRRSAFNWRLAKQDLSRSALTKRAIFPDP